MTCSCILPQANWITPKSQQDCEGFNCKDLCFLCSLKRLGIKIGCRVAIKTFACGLF